VLANQQNVVFSRMSSRFSLSVCSSDTRMISSQLRASWLLAL
jgi:hypothetical protein